MEYATLPADPTEAPLTGMNMDLPEPLAKQDPGKYLRGTVEGDPKLPIEGELGGITGAGRHSRRRELTKWRNEAGRFGRFRK